MRAVKRVIVTSLFVLMSCAQLRAEQLPVRTYTTADGLPSDRVYKIVRDPRGFSDIGLPGMDGISGIAILKQRYPDLLILMLTVYDDNGRIFDALCAGACGYLLKKTPWEKVVDAGTHQVRSSRKSPTPRPHKMIQTRTNCAFQYVKSALSI